MTTGTLLFTILLILRRGLWYSLKKKKEQEGAFFEVAFETPTTNHCWNRGKFYAKIVCFFIFLVTKKNCFRKLPRGLYFHALINGLV